MQYFGRVSTKAQMEFSHPKNISQTSKIVGVIVISNEYTYQILCQDVSICPLFGL